MNAKKMTDTTGPLLKWNNPEKIVRTKIDSETVLLPLWGGRAELERVDKYGERHEKPLLHLFAHAVDKDWNIVLRVPVDTELNVCLIPDEIADIFLDGVLFRNGQRFEIVRLKSEPISEVERIARELRAVRMGKETAAVASADGIPAAANGKAPLLTVQSIDAMPKDRREPWMNCLLFFSKSEKKLAREKWFELAQRIEKSLQVIQSDRMKNPKAPTGYEYLTKPQTDEWLQKLATMKSADFMKRLSSALRRDIAHKADGIAKWPESTD